VTDACINVTPGVTRRVHPGYLCACLFRICFVLLYAYECIPVSAPNSSLLRFCNVRIHHIGRTGPSSGHLHNIVRRAFRCTVTGSEAGAFNSLRVHTHTIILIYYYYYFIILFTYICFYLILNEKTTLFNEVIIFYKYISSTIESYIGIRNINFIKIICKTFSKRSYVTCELGRLSKICVKRVLSKLLMW